MASDPRVGVGTLGWITNAQDQVLCLKRKKRETGRDNGGGTWSVPGGWVDFGETPEVAVSREVFEETGLVGLTGELLDAVVHTERTAYEMHCVCLIYRVHLTSEDQVPQNLEPEKHESLGWLSLDELLDGRPLFDPLDFFLARPNGAKVLLSEHLAL